MTSRADVVPREAERAASPLSRRLRDMLALVTSLLGERAAPKPNYPTIRPLAATDVTVLESNKRRRAARLESATSGKAADAGARQSTLVSPPPARLARIADATIAAGVVQLPDRTIIEESLFDTSRLDRFGPFSRDTGGRIKQARRGARRHLRGGPHVLLKQQHDSNYGHWLMEGLPRLAIVEDHIRLADCKFIVSAHHGPMRQIHEDSLALFGIRRDQIVEVGDEMVRVDDLLYPTPIPRHPWHFAPRCVEVLELIASRVRANPFAFGRLYVSRNKTATRHLLNEAEIIAIAERHGFIVVEPETLSLYQQIGLFRGARIVVGNRGAALTNTVFALGDVTLFALTSPLMQDDFLPTMMSLKHGRFLSQHGVASDPALGPASDFSLDPAMFETMLKTIV